MLTRTDIHLAHHHDRTQALAASVDRAGWRHRLRWLGTSLMTIVLPLALQAAGYAADFLSLGSSGSEVTSAQQQLRDLGYSVSVDGYFGDDTEQAVKAFQRDKGLYVDGVIGEDTREFLFGSGYNSNEAQVGFETFPSSVTPSGNIIPSSYTASFVRQLQKWLSELGYYNGVRDGIYGEGTRDAVRNFQRDNKLQVTGYIDSRTLSALRGVTQPSRTGYQEVPASGSRYYFVLVPAFSGVPLSRVKFYIQDAFIRPDGLIQAGKFGDRYSAETRYRYLQRRGIREAHMRYLPDQLRDNRSANF